MYKDTRVDISNESLQRHLTYFTKGRKTGTVSEYSKVYTPPD